MGTSNETDRRTGLTPTAIAILAGAAEDNKTMLWQYQHLEKHGLLDAAGKITPKGRAHLQQLANTPFPRRLANLWIDADGVVIRDYNGNAFAEES